MMMLSKRLKSKICSKNRF